MKYTSLYMFFLLCTTPLWCMRQDLPHKPSCLKTNVSQEQTVLPGAHVVPPTPSQIASLYNLGLQTILFYMMNVTLLPCYKANVPYFIEHPELAHEFEQIFNHFCDQEFIKNNINIPVLTVWYMERFLEKNPETPTTWDDIVIAFFGAWNLAQKNLLDVSFSFEKMLDRIESLNYQGPLYIGDLDVNFFKTQELFFLTTLNNDIFMSREGYQSFIKKIDTVIKHKICLKNMIDVVLHDRAAKTPAIAFVNLSPAAPLTNVVNDQRIIPFLENEKEHPFFELQEDTGLGIDDQDEEEQDEEFEEKTPKKIESQAKRIKTFYATQGAPSILSVAMMNAQQADLPRIAYSSLAFSPSPLVQQSVKPQEMITVWKH
ncbi:MAG: hypothetical protein UU47_C0003G0006 [candidate division TM6 bacterium GW2011_GWE2_41_16]|nr:MAG: hypothetical protein UU47_C0003G0006 [candidate division TM6 bacterium GW2011_GWE2_41_16]